jgi:O-antigen/teichoic acid export membrane protein
MRLADVFKDGLVSAITNVIALLAAFVSVRLFVTTFSSEEYGVWVVVNAIAAWFLAIDFGLGQAVQNYAVRKRIQGDRLSLAAGIWGSTFILLALACGIVLIDLLIGSRAIAKLLNLENLVLSRQLYPGITVFFAGLAFAAALRIGGSLLRAVHRSPAVNIQAMLKSVVPVLVVLAAIALHLALAPVLAAVGVATGLLEAGLFILGVRAFQPLPWPQPHAFRAALRELVGPSLLFFLYQIGLNALILVQAFIVSHSMSIVEAGRFNPTYRLWFISLTFFNSACIPLVARFNEAHHRCDHALLVRSFTRITGLVALAGLLTALAYLVFAPTFVRLWVGPSFVYGAGLYALLAASVFPAVMTCFFAAVLTGLERTRALAFIYGIGGSVFVVVAVLLARVHGIAGLAVAMLAIYLALAAALALACCSALAIPLPRLADASAKLATGKRKRGGSSN